MQTLGLNIYSYIEDSDIQFYEMQMFLVKKVDVLDWIPMSYGDDIIQEGENPLDMVKCINLEEIAQMMSSIITEHLMGVHHDNPSCGPHNKHEKGEEEEKENKKVEGEEEAWATCFTQQSKTP